METLQQDTGPERVAGQHQYLTFTLGTESYGIDILRVQEIKGHTAITPIPNAPAHVRGVLNLRGTIVPVVDLRTRFGMPVAENDSSSVIVIVTSGEQVVGLIVDAVSDVLDVRPEDVDPPPELGGDPRESFLLGLARTGDDILALLAIDRVINQGRESELVH